MGAMFPSLGKKSVHITIAEGRWIDVPMLSIEDYAEFKTEQEKLLPLAESNDLPKKIEAVETCRKKMVWLAKKVMPLELHDDLGRMPFESITGLIKVLCTGEDDSANDDPQKKITLPSQRTP